MQADAPPGGTKLASQKYFTPKDLNDLGRVGKNPLPGIRKDSANRSKPAANAAGPSRGAPLV